MLSDDLVCSKCHASVYEDLFTDFYYCPLCKGYRARDEVIKIPATKLYDTCIKCGREMCKELDAYYGDIEGLGMHCTKCRTETERYMRLKGWT